MRTQRNVTKHEQPRRGVVHRSGLRALTVGALIATPLLAVAGTAHATTNVRVSGGQLSINSGNISDNMSVNVDLDGSFIIRNFNDTLITGGACQKITNAVRCSSVGITNIQVNLQGGNDILRHNTGLPLRAFLGSGNDKFFGGSGRDFVNGDNGSDTLEGNGGNDTLVGDAGNDAGFGGAGSDFCDTESRDSCESS